MNTSDPGSVSIPALESSVEKAPVDCGRNRSVNNRQAGQRIFFRVASAAGNAGIANAAANTSGGTRANTSSCPECSGDREYRATSTQFFLKAQYRERHCIFWIAKVQPRTLRLRLILRRLRWSLSRRSGNAIHL